MRKRIAAVLVAVVMIICSSVSVAASDGKAEVNHVEDGTVPIQIGALTFDLPNWPMMETSEDSIAFFPTGSNEDILFLFMVTELNKEDRDALGQSWDEAFARFTAEGTLKDVTKKTDVEETSWLTLENGNGIAMSVDWRTKPHYTVYVTFVDNYMIIASAVDYDLYIDDYIDDLDAILSSARVEDKE